MLTTKKKNPPITDFIPEHHLVVLFCTTHNKNSYNKHICRDVLVRPVCICSYGLYMSLENTKKKKP